MIGRLDQDADQQLGRLAEAWEKVTGHWHDDQTRRFSADHWTPLVHETRQYVAALGQLTDVLEAAERETGDSDLGGAGGRLGLYWSQVVGVG